MVRARFFDGDGENGQPVDDVEVDVVPRVGEIVRFSYWNEHDDRYRVTSVEYLMDRGKGVRAASQLVGEAIRMILSQNIM